MNPEFYIGTSGWSYNHWKGVFYPEKLPQKGWLQYYSGIFNTVEVNMTFYRFPRESAVQGWAGKTADDFLFTLKAPKIITHVKRLTDIENPLYRFYDLLDLLGHKGRAVLFQMPPSFRLSSANAKRIENLLEHLDSSYEHFMEFRDSSWWNSEVYALLRGRCGFCSVSGLEMPREIVLTDDKIYLRLHGGHYNLLYGEHELNEYAERLYGIAGERSLRKVYIYFNNDYNGYAVKNGISMKRIIAEMWGC